MCISIWIQCNVFFFFFIQAFFYFFFKYALYVFAIFWYYSSIFEAKTLWHDFCHSKKLVFHCIYINVYHSESKVSTNKLKKLTCTTKNFNFNKYFSIKQTLTFHSVSFNEILSSIISKKYNKITIKFAFYRCKAFMKARTSMENVCPFRGYTCLENYMNATV